MEKKRVELNDWMKSINQTKNNMMVDDPSTEKGYPPFIVNKCLAGHRDSILFANEMNKNPHLDKRLQYDFLINTLKPRKRFTPWIKKQTLGNLELVKEYYGYSHDKAMSALEILSNDEIEQIRKALNKGGMT